MSSRAAASATRLYSAWKRLFDIVTSAVLLLLLIPVFVCVAIAVKLDSRGPVLYRCRRVGFRGREFAMLKFRKMRADASGPALTVAEDERFTRIGRFLAASKLDEIPQFWHVLKGQMSLVGPRPEDPEFVSLHRDDYAPILQVKPGITGLCQLAFAKEAAFLDPSERLHRYVERLLPQKMALDRLYAAKRSFSMDFRILAWTMLAVVFRRDVAVHRHTGCLSLRRPRRPAHALTIGADQEVRSMRNGNNPIPSKYQAVILAGGLGRRLAPFTSVLPKPLMPVGDRAVLEIVVGQLASYGFTDITFCVGYLSHLIRAIFDSRLDRSIDIRYVQEEKPLGTAAPVRLIEGLDGTFILMNGDVLTTLDYRELLRRHREDGNVLTVATMKRTVKIDYGVVYVEDGLGRVERWEEKPEIVSLVSMGVYAVEPSVIEFIPEGEYFDFPDLVQALLRAGQPVGCYLYDGIWFDIGRRDDYEQAVASWTSNGNGHPHDENGHPHVSPDGAIRDVR